MSDGDTTDVMESLDPSKMLRLGSMTKNLLDEMHAMPLDQGGRERLTGIHARAVAELEANLPEPLRREFATLAPHLRTASTVSDAELRIAEAQLVGWLEGLFQGLQFAAAMQQAAAAQRH